MRSKRRLILMEKSIRGELLISGMLIYRRKEKVSELIIRFFFVLYFIMLIVLICIVLYVVYSLYGLLINFLDLSYIVSLLKGI